MLCFSPMRQIHFDSLDIKHSNNQKIYGGSLLKGKRKSARPLDSKKPLHLVLKATNSFALLRNQKLIEQLNAKMSQRFGVKVYSIAVQADHIHLNISFASRRIYTMWIRALTGALARKIQKLKFKFLPFTRIGSWGRDFKTVQNYILKNRIEGDFLLTAHASADRIAERNRTELCNLFAIFDLGHEQACLHHF